VPSNTRQDAGRLLLQTQTAIRRCYPRLSIVPKTKDGSSRFRTLKYRRQPPRADPHCPSWPWPSQPVRSRGIREGPNPPFPMTTSAKCLPQVGYAAAPPPSCAVATSCHRDQAPRRQTLAVLRFTRPRSNGRALAMIHLSRRNRPLTRCPNQLESGSLISADPERWGKQDQAKLSYCDV
jgi:hypothetical protein